MRTLRRAVLLLATFACILTLNPATKATPQAQVTACVNGMAAGYPCANIDLLAFLPHSAIGGGPSDHGNDIWGWVDPQTNREYALVGQTNGTAFVDITDPLNPVHLGNLPPHTANSIWRDLEVHADHAFIVSEATGSGMQVFDLTQLRNVASPPATFSETAHYAGFDHAHTITANTQTGFAYVNGSNTCSGGLHVINIQNPASPMQAGCFAADGYTHDSQCVIYNGPDAPFRGRELCFASNEDTLTIVDVTNKSAPMMLSRTTYTGSGYTHQGWLTEDHAFFLLDDEFDETTLNANTRTHIFNLASLAAPQRTAIYEAATLAIDHNQFVFGNFVYQANYRAGLRILELTGIASGVLREVAYFDIYPADDNPSFNAAWSIYPFFPSGNVVINGIEQGLFIVRPNLAGNPQGLPNFSTSASPASRTVTRGQPATFTLTVTTQNSFTSPVTLSCAGLPMMSNCSFPINPVIPSSGTFTVNVTIGTTAAAFLNSPEEIYWASAWPLVLLAAAGVLSLGGKKKTRLASTALLLLCIAALPGCGGDGGGNRITPPPPTGGTPPGNYSVTINATSGQIRRAVTVNLTVQ